MMMYTASHVILLLHCLYNQIAINLELPLNLNIHTADKATIPILKLVLLCSTSKQNINLIIKERIYEHRGVKSSTHTWVASASNLQISLVTCVVKI